MPSARIYLTLSRHLSLSFIVTDRSSWLTELLYADRAAVCRFELVPPAFARPCKGFHKSTSLMSSSLLLQPCPACLVHLTWIVFVMVGRWPYSCSFVGRCLQDLFNIARSILVYLSSSFFSSCLKHIYLQKNLSHSRVNMIFISLQIPSLQSPIVVICTSRNLFRSSSSSSSSCRAASMDSPNPLSPLVPIVHRLWLVFRATSRILT